MESWGGGRGAGELLNVGCQVGPCPRETVKSRLGGNSIRVSVVQGKRCGGRRARAQVHTACGWAAQGLLSPRSRHSALGSWGTRSPLSFPGGDGQVSALREEMGPRGLDEGRLWPLCRRPGLRCRGARVCGCAGVQGFWRAVETVAEMFPQTASPSATLLAEGCHLERVG